MEIGTAGAVAVVAEIGTEEEEGGPTITNGHELTGKRAIVDKNEMSVDKRCIGDEHDLLLKY